MTFTAQLGTANSQLGQVVLDYWAYTVTPPDVQQPYAPVWLVEIAPAPPGLAVGVDYLATGTDHASTAFLTSYHVPAVRALVLAQLAAMAAAGTDVIRTVLYFVGGVGPLEAWRHHFPPEPQEVDNLILFSQDVAATGMALELACGWIGCSSYSSGAPPGCPSSLTWEGQFVSMETTLDLLIAGYAAASLHPRRIFLDVELTLAKPRTDEFLRRMWPRLQSGATSIGALPSLYYLSAAAAVAGTDFLRAEGLPVPERTELSLYPATESGVFTLLLSKVETELAILRAAGHSRIAIAETLYPISATERRAVGAAFATAPALEQILIWPLSSDFRYRAVAPFDLAPYGVA